MTCCKVTCIDEGLRSFFGWLGYHVGKRPCYFIIVPILLTALCASGFQRITYEADPEYLFSPIDGEGKFERAQLEKHFPMNYSEAFDPARVIRPPRFGRLLISAKDNGSLLRTRIFEQIMHVDYLVYNLTINADNGYAYKFEDLCAFGLSGHCWSNDILRINEIMPEIEAGERSLPYPVYISVDENLQLVRIPFPFFSGGLTVDSDNIITDIKYISLNYFLVSETDFDLKM